MIIKMLKQLGLMVVMMAVLSGALIGGVILANS